VGVDEGLGGAGLGGVSHDNLLWKDGAAKRRGVLDRREFWF